MGNTAGLSRNLGGGCVYSGCRNKVPQTGWLKQQELVFPQFWSLESGLVSGKTSLPDSDVAEMLLSAHVAFLLWVFRDTVPVCVKDPF